MKSIAQRNREELEKGSREFAEGFVGQYPSIGTYILDENGEVKKETDIYVWAAWMEKTDKAVAYDEIGPAMISTVFLGLDHNLFSYPPILFETMVFVPDDSFTGTYSIDKATMMYTTREDALEGHNNVVMFLKGLADKGGLK